jgi:hypothetical protein
MLGDEDPVMPLRDHFRPPLSRERHWEAFHAAWAGSIADALNRTLPPGYFAEEHTHAGASAEIDVATFEQATPAPPLNGTGGVAVAPAVWAPPAPAATVPAVFADDFEVRVFSGRGGPTLVAAVELVSPANKDRPETRRAFATKCASYLHGGVAVVVLDVVTDRRATLHHDVLDLLAATAGRLAGDPPLYAAAYRPVRRDERAEVDVWAEPLDVGEPLPTLPLWLDAVTALPVDAEATYADACARRRIA